MIRRTYDIDVIGVITGTQLAARRMVARGRGQIVNVSSGLGYLPSRRTVAYCATKSGVLMLSQSLRADWDAAGVGVSAICPGVINTPILSRSRLRDVSTRDNDLFDRLFHRGHPPETVAKAIERATARNSPVVPIGFESVLAYLASRVAPGPLRALVGRL